MMPEPQVDYDSAWKEVLERYFEEFTAFFFPQAHAEIDWTMGHEFLDKELQQVVRDAELRRRLADKLVKVWSRDGEEAWVLVHVEVQGGVEREFAKRMYVYNTRRTQKCLMSPVSNAGASNNASNKASNKGIQQGLLQKSREDVIEILEARFESVAGSIVQIVNRTDDLSILKMLLKKAATIGSLEEFKKVLEKVLKSGQ
jgi:hypothetical protein